MFDETVTRKPAYFGVVAALSGTNSTKTSISGKAQPSGSRAYATANASNGTVRSTISPTAVFKGSGVRLYEVGASGFFLVTFLAISLGF